MASTTQVKDLPNGSDQAFNNASLQYSEDTYQAQYLDTFYDENMIGIMEIIIANLLAADTKSMEYIFSATHDRLAVAGRIFPIKNLSDNLSQETRTWQATLTMPEMSETAAAIKKRKAEVMNALKLAGGYNINHGDITIETLQGFYGLVQTALMAIFAYALAKYDNDTTTTKDGAFFIDFINRVANNDLKEDFNTILSVGMEYLSSQTFKINMPNNETICKLINQYCELITGKAIFGGTYASTLKPEHIRLFKRIGIKNPYTFINEAASLPTARNQSIITTSVIGHGNQYAIKVY